MVSLLFLHSSHSSTPNLPKKCNFTSAISFILRFLRFFWSTVLWLKYIFSALFVVFCLTLSKFIFLSFSFVAYHLPPFLLFLFSPSVRGLGVIIDATFAFSGNIITIARACRLIHRFVFPILSCLNRLSAIKWMNSLIPPDLFIAMLYITASLILTWDFSTCFNQSCCFCLISCRNTPPSF